jgi:ABC-2 type transport system permease protein
MNVFTALMRRHWLESRMTLGLGAAAFAGLSVLVTWRVNYFERLIERGELGPAIRRYGFLKVLGGANMDYSTTALEVCWWNHPVILLPVLCWAVARGAGAVAGEVERGTVDMTLSRPVSRLTYLASHVAFAVLGLAILAGALVAGDLIGAAVYRLKSPPSVLTLMRPAAMLVTLGMAVFGYTLPFSAVDVVRWRPMLASSAVTLGGLIAMTLAPQFEGYDWLEKLSVFRAYAPVTVALKGEPLGFNASVLCLVFAAGLLVAYPLYAHRDIPSNS